VTSNKNPHKSIGIHLTGEKLLPNISMSKRDTFEFSTSLVDFGERDAFGSRFPKGVNYLQEVQNYFPSINGA